MNPSLLRNEFPQLNCQVKQKPFVYLDNAATTLKPQAVIDRVTLALSSEVANVHRGAHVWSDRATADFEAARESVCHFLGARSANEIVFTRGTTEGLNLLAQTLAPTFISTGDEVLLTMMEHHSNIVPWQLAAKRFGFTLKFVPVTERGELDVTAFRNLLNAKTKVFSLTGLSNALGTINPLKQLIAEAKSVGALTIVDGAQSISAGPTNVQDLDCDFYVFSGHKIFAPTGIGILYGREELLNRLPPYQGGGSMISTVTINGSEYLPSPQRFEAGTPAIVEAIGLGSALDFVSKLGWSTLQHHERELMQYALKKLTTVDGLNLIGTASERAHVVSFSLLGAHHSDVAAILNEQGVAVRAGHHCCQPLMQALGMTGTVRASFSIYNTMEDVDCLYLAVLKAKELLT